MPMMRRLSPHQPPASRGSCSLSGEPAAQAGGAGDRALDRRAHRLLGAGQDQPLAARVTAV